VNAAEQVGLAILEALVQQLGLPFFVKYLTGKASAADAQTMLDAEYAAARAAADAEAKAVL
jgi:hypothetical protein